MDKIILVVICCRSFLLAVYIKNTRPEDCCLLLLSLICVPVFTVCFVFFEGFFVLFQGLCFEFGQLNFYPSFLDKIVSSKGLICDIDVVGYNNVCGQNINLQIDCNWVKETSLVCFSDETKLLRFTNHAFSRDLDIVE